MSRPSVPAELFHYGQRTDITKLTVAFALVPTRLINLHYTKDSVCTSQRAQCFQEKDQSVNIVYFPLTATVTTNESENCVEKMRGVTLNLY
jgi:hypothetical protein